MKEITTETQDARVRVKRCLLGGLLLLLFILSGCLDCERASISVDLIQKTAEVKFSNVVSNSVDAETIKEDFGDLIKKVYFDEESASDPARITSRRLYDNNGKLDGIERFSFQSLPKVLKEFNIEVDNKGDYILDLTKESEHYRISGNGHFVEKGSKKLLRWPKNAKKIEFEEKSKEFNEAEKTNLLGRWLEWVDKNRKELGIKKEK